MGHKLDAISPGEILLEEFMKPLGVSQNKLSRDIDVPPGRINDIIHTKRAITADTALRFAEYFQTTPEFWMNLQTRYSLKKEKESFKSNIRAHTRADLMTAH